MYSTDQIWIADGGQEISDAAVKEGVYRLWLIWDGVFESGDDRASNKRWLWLEVLPQLRKKCLGINKSKFTQTLGHNIPRTFLWALKVLIEDAPVVIDAKLIH